MQLINFIKSNSLKPADAIVLKNVLLGLVDHYAIYLGKDNGEEAFMINISSGTKIVSAHDFSRYNLSFSAINVRRFKGNDLQRKTAVHMALSRRDQESYHIIRNNCHHTINYQKQEYGYNHETTTVGTGLALGGLALAASSKNSSTRNIGITMAIFGLLALTLKNND